MSKFKEILHSQFRYVFPDLVKKDILTIDEFRNSDIRNYNDEHYNVSRFYKGFIANIPTEVTYENLDSIKEQLDQVYQSIYKQVDKDSKYYDSFNFIIVRGDFEMDIFKDFATKTNHLKLNLRLQFVDTSYYVIKVQYYS